MNNKKTLDLTPQELVVVRLLCDGLSNREIAEPLGISIETVKTNITHLCDKVGASTRLELAIMAISKGLVSVCADRREILEEIETVHCKIEKYVARSRALAQQLSSSSAEEPAIGGVAHVD